MATVAGAWCGVLALLTWYSANPVVVNPLQIQRSDLVVQGRWTDAAARTLRVECAWKAAAPGETITVKGVPGRVPLEGSLIVPLTRTADGSWMVTQGILENPSAHPDRVPSQRSEVQPALYPATESVLEQLNALLPAAPAAP